MATVEIPRLPPQLIAIQREMEDYARGYGLDFYPTIFEYIEELEARFGAEHEALVLSEIESKEAIYDSIKQFLGKGK